MALASQKFPEWDETLKRMPALEAYLAWIPTEGSGPNKMPTTDE